MNTKYHFIDRSHNFEEISAITYLHMDKIIGLPQPFRWLPTPQRHKWLIIKKGQELKQT